NVFNNFYNGVISNEPIQVNYTAFNGNLSSQFKFNKGWTAEISGWYNSKQLVSSAILMNPMGMFSLGAGKQILKGKGTVRVNLRDPLYLASFTGFSDLAAGTTYIHSKWDNRRCVITFNYRFGKTKQVERNRGSASDDERSRINT